MTTFNNFPSSSGLGLPGAGFASRGKSNGIKRLNLASPPKIGSISEDPSADVAVPTPRTSRSHLLAGLRTAPRTPGAPPASAPYSKTSHGAGNYSAPNYGQQHASYGNVPHTATGAHFPSLGQHQQQQQYGMKAGQQFYTLPEQVLAPPTLELNHQEDHIDPEMFAQLYATKVYLAQRQRALQEQIASLTAQQLAGLNLNGDGLNHYPQTSFPQTPLTPQLGLYNQQQPAMHNAMQNAMSHIVTQEVPGQPGVYLVTNTLNGQSTLAYDPNYQAPQDFQLANSPPPPTPSRITTNFRADFRNETGSPFDSGSPFGSRSLSPPKKTSSPAQDVAPLPPPSANAFRRGQHNRNKSSLVLNNVNGTAVSDGPKSAFTRPVGMPATPMTGTFGPGQARAGEHPMRQPAGPPAIEELKAKPTSKHEGSKNFATRQRRRALNKLVRAGFERRIVGRNGSGSAGSMTPVSDTELTFSIPSDNDSDGGNASIHNLSGKGSMASLRTATRPIGSERKHSKESIRSN